MSSTPPKCPSPAPASPEPTKKGTTNEEDSNNYKNNKNDSPKTKTDNVNKPTSASGAPLPLVSTPARDPALIMAKRMQNLQLHNSPAPLNNNIAAGSPMRTFNPTPNRQFDLTPVMKNTSQLNPSDAGDLDLDLDLELDFDLDMLDSRGGDEMNTVFSPRPLPSSSRLPPLAKRGLVPPKRPEQDTMARPIAIEIPENAYPPIRAPEFAFLPPVEDPVPFPPAGGKACYSFTSMKQYEKHRLQSEPAAVISETAGLQPYQPSRQDPGLVDIPKEELNSIFTTRRTASHALSTPESTFSEDDSNTNMRELFPAIPLEERQWSIPSIRMANQLGGSIASCTTSYTDEDDESLLMYRDDASLSSYGSFSHLLINQGADNNNNSAPNTANSIQAVFVVGGDQQVAFDTTVVPQQQQQLQLQTEEDEEGMDTGDDSSLPDAPPDQTMASRYHHHRRREKKKEQRERKALEWLRTVQAGKDEVAEAASSKFLTRRNDNIIVNATPQVLYDKPQKRPSTAVVESRTFAFLAKELEDDSCCGDDDSIVKTNAAYEEVFATPAPSN